MSTSGSLRGAHEARGIFFVRSQDGDMALHTHIPNQATAGIYRDLTFNGETAGLSYYFLDRWLGVIDPIRVSIYARLRAIARIKGTPSPSLSDLAGSITLKPDRIRTHFTRWWFTPQPDNPEWQFFQAAVELVRRDGETYQFRGVVLGDILHPDDLAILDGRLQKTGADGQQELLVGDPTEIPTPRKFMGDSHEIHGGPGATPMKSMGVPSEIPRGAAPSPPAPPLPGCLHVHGPGIATTPGSENESGAVYPPVDAAACLLAERGVSELGVEVLRRYPDWAYWAVRWCTWVTVKQGLRNVGGFLFNRIRGACEGVPEDRKPPLGWIIRQEEGRRERKSRERTASKLADRPKPEYQRPEEAPAVTVAPELLGPWSQFQAACKLAKVSSWLLEAAAPLSLEGGTLKVQAAGSLQAEQLRLRKSRILTRAGELGAEFTDLVITTPTERTNP